MKETDFIADFKQEFSAGIDKSKCFDIYPPPKEKHPFIVKVDNEELGCVYLHFEWGMQPPMVWVMYLKSYKHGSGSSILSLLCKLADKQGVLLYLEPAPDKGSRLNHPQLVTWYRRHGFLGEATMVRQPNA